MKRKRPDALEEFFEKLLAHFQTQGKHEEAEEVTRLKSTLSAPEGDRVAAGDFTLAEVVDAFGLKYRTDVSVMNPHIWNIEKLPETKGFVPTPCLASLVKNYSKNFARSSEATCRTGLDFILNECLTVMKDNQAMPEDQPTDEPRRSTPTPWDDIQIHGEMSFNHRIIPRAAAVFKAAIVTGRVDYGIGRVLKSRARTAAKQLKRRFQSLLLIVEAKIALNVDHALPQLLVYLASLHQSRLQRQRSDATVYGVASDGFTFLFVTITHDGEVKLSKHFNITEGDIGTVLGCLKYVLEMSANMSPNLTPEKDSERRKEGNDHKMEDPADPAIDLDDNNYTNPPQDSDDDSEWV